MPTQKRLNPARRITYRQMLFCQALATNPTITATQAAIQAGYSPKTAKSQASRLLSQPIIDHYRWLYLTELRHDTVPEPKPKRQKLSSKQFMFMICYMNPSSLGRPRNGKEAAINAGYSPKYATQIASRLLKHPEIRGRIESWQGDRKTLRELLNRRLAQAQRWIGR